MTTEQNNTTQITDQELDKVDDGKLSEKDLDTVRRQTKVDTSAPLRRDTSERMAA